MRSPDRVLARFLQVSGAIVLLALPAVVFPYGWMDVIHGWLGLGALPDEPMVAYLARSASALYAGLGALYLFVARDVRYYRDLLRFFGWTHLLFGVVVLGIDVAVGMPRLWTAVEGPFVIGWSAVLLGLVTKVSGTSPKRERGAGA